MPRKSGEQDVEMLAVLVRAKDKSFRACPGVLHGGDAVAADGRSGSRGTHRRGQRGGATAAARSRVTRGEESRPEMNGGEGRAGQGERVFVGGRAEAEGAEGVQR
jgi:hypothetical protein